MRRTCGALAARISAGLFANETVAILIALFSAITFARRHESHFAAGAVMPRVYVRYVCTKYLVLKELSLVGQHSSSSFLRTPITSTAHIYNSVAMYL